MVFSSISFLFFFLPAFLLIFHLLKPKLKFVFLFLSSLFFYFWGENILVWILLTSTGIDYLAGLFIAEGFRKKEILKLDPGLSRTRKQKIGLTISIISNLCFLGYFKYSNFFIDNFISFIHHAGIDSLISEHTAKIALPLGISFYTFQSMSYTIDVYRGKVAATGNFIKFAAYVTMFPQLVAGPIVRYSDIEGQISNYKIRLDDFISGIKRFIIGLAKKVIIANTMASVADTVFALPSSELTTGLAWLGVVAYSLQIYFDFSGYSCMAIGLGRMIGLNFPENFNYPYISRSIREFWQRWHISLSTWFRDYLYIPLGGNRKGNLMTYRNLIIVFFVCGLWHGASWNFAIWGLFHGFFIILERLPFLRLIGKVPKTFQHIYVILVVTLGWVFFRTETLFEALHYLSVLAGNSPAGEQWYKLQELLQVNVIGALIVGIVLSTPVFFRVRSTIYSMSNPFIYLIKNFYQATLLAVFFFCVMAIASGAYNPFIYFRF